MKVKHPRRRSTKVTIHTHVGNPKEGSLILFFWVAFLLECEKQSSKIQFKLQNSRRVERVEGGERKRRNSVSRLMK